MGSLSIKLEVRTQKFSSLFFKQNKISTIQNMLQGSVHSHLNDFQVTRVLIRVWTSLDESHESRKIAGQQTRTGESAAVCTYVRVH